MPDNARLIMSTGEPPKFKTFVVELHPHVIEWIKENDPKFIGVELRTPEAIANSEQLAKERVRENVEK